MGISDAEADYAHTSYPGQFRWLMRANNQELYDVWEYYYPPDFGFDRVGYLLGEDLKTIRSFYEGQPPAALVGHEMGGLAIRAYIEETSSNFLRDYPGGSYSEVTLSYASDISRVLFLGTPHYGSFYATRSYYNHLFPWSAAFVEWFTERDNDAPALREMGIGSDAISRLNKADPGHQGVPYLQISGATAEGTMPLGIDIESSGHSDGWTSVSSGSLLDRGVPLVILPEFSHDQLASPQNERRQLSPTERAYIPNIMVDWFINHVVPSADDHHYVVNPITQQSSISDARITNALGDHTVFNRGLVQFRLQTPDGNFWRPEKFIWRPYGNTDPSFRPTTNVFFGPAKDQYTIGQGRFRFKIGNIPNKTEPHILFEPLPQLPNNYATLTVDKISELLDGEALGPIVTTEDLFNKILDVWENPGLIDPEILPIYWKVKPYIEKLAMGGQFAWYAHSRNPGSDFKNYLPVTSNIFFAQTHFFQEIASDPNKSDQLVDPKNQIPGTNERFLDFIGAGWELPYPDSVEFKTYLQLIKPQAGLAATPNKYKPRVFLYGSRYGREEFAKFNYPVEVAGGDPRPGYLKTTTYDLQIPFVFKWQLDQVEVWKIQRAYAVVNDPGNDRAYVTNSSEPDSLLHWVDCAINSYSNLLHYGENTPPSFHLVDPNGQTIDPTTTNDSTVFFWHNVEAKIMAYTLVGNGVTAGEWITFINEEPFLPDDSYSNFITRDVQNTLITLQSDTVVIDSLVLHAFLPLDMDSPVETQTVEGITVASGSAPLNVAFADDGLGYDQLPGDGIFTAIIPRAQDSAQYYSVVLEGIMNGCDIVRKSDGTLVPCQVTSLFVSQNVDLNGPVCASTSVDFLNLSDTYDGGLIVKSSWDFGDGTTTETRSPEHEYSAAGVYYPTLTVYTNGGCSATFTDTITVLEAPVAELNETVTDQVSCDNEVTLAMVEQPESQVGALSYQWSRLEDPSWVGVGRELTISQGGTYVGEISNGACADFTDTVHLRFSELPTASLTLSDSVTVAEASWCEDEPDTLMLIGTFVQAQWEVDMGGGSYQVVAEGDRFSPSASGTYRGRIFNADSCSVVTASVAVTVMPRLVANELFIESQSCYNGTLTLNGETPLSYETTTWFEVDTEGPIGTGPTLEVTEAGNYYARFEASGACGVESSAVWANPRPTNLSLSAPSGSFVCNESVTLRVDMDHVLGAEDELSWWYRDELGHQHHVFDATNQLEYTTTLPGTYRVRLVFAAEDPNGTPNKAHVAICVQSDEVQVRIGDALPIPTVTALDDKQITCQPDSVVLIAEPGFPNYVWNNGVEGDTLVLTEPMDRARAFTVSVSSQTCTSTSEAIGAYVKPGPVLNYTEIHGDTIYQDGCEFAVTRDISLGDTQVERYDWYYLTGVGDTVLSGIGAPFFRLNRFDSTLQVFCVVTNRESECSDTTGIFTLINTPELIYRPMVYNLNPGERTDEEIFIWGPNNGEDGLPEVEFFLEARQATDERFDTYNWALFTAAGIDNQDGLSQADLDFVTAQHGQFLHIPSVKIKDSRPIIVRLQYENSLSGCKTDYEDVFTILRIDGNFDNTSQIPKPLCEAEGTEFGWRLLPEYLDSAQLWEGNNYRGTAAWVDDTQGKASTPVRTRTLHSAILWGQDQMGRPIVAQVLDWDFANPTAPQDTTALAAPVVNWISELDGSVKLFAHDYDDEKYQAYRWLNASEFDTSPGRDTLLLTQASEPEIREVALSVQGITKHRNNAIGCTFAPVEPFWYTPPVRNYCQDEPIVVDITDQTGPDSDFGDAEFRWEWSYTLEDGTSFLVDQITEGKVFNETFAQYGTLHLQLTQKVVEIVLDDNGLPVEVVSWVPFTNPMIISVAYHVLCYPPAAPEIPLAEQDREEHTIDFLETDCGP
ncbi:MAG TPA: hypothetical protein DCP28_33960, partial [Cytophagales bacterium]|nr:hypothetical protein [Cytophagales bacterium]